MLALLLGCPGEPPVLDPRVTILTPTDGATVSGPEVAVEVEVEDFDLVPAETTAWRWPRLLPVAHAHDPGDDPEGYVLLLLDQVEVAAAADTAFVLEGLEPGSYDLVAELRWPDGDAFYPPVRDAVTFTVL